MLSDVIWVKLTDVKTSASGVERLEPTTQKLTQRQRTGSSYVEMQISLIPVGTTVNIIVYI